MLNKKLFSLCKNKLLGSIITSLAFVFTVILLATSAQAAITITNQSGSVVYTDFGNGQNSVYLVFQITSTSAEADAWVELDDSASTIIQNVGTGVHQLQFKPGAGTAAPIPENGLVVGQAKGVFFLVSASGATGTPQNLTINVYDGDPDGSGSIIGTKDFGFTVEDTIQANANKVNTVVTIPDNPIPGELGKITVTGCTGPVGAQNVLYFSPVTANTWPADTFEFVDSVVVIEGYPGTPYKNIAKIPTADVAANTDDHCYTETFTFIINGPATASTTPSNYVASGQPIKHTTNDSGSFDVIIEEECPDITVVSNPTTIPTGTSGIAYGPVTFSASGGTGPYTFEASPGSLPAGITLSSDGVLSGSTTETGTFNFTVTATDSAVAREPCTGQTTRNLVIKAPPSENVPTLSEWGMIIMSLLLAGSAIWMIRRRQTA
jgi:hypothetical protein